MKIEIKLIENAINNLVANVGEQRKGLRSPQLSTNEAISMLGTASALVLSIHEQAREQGASEDLLKGIWDLKQSSDTLIQKLFDDCISVDY